RMTTSAPTRSFLVWYLTQLAANPLRVKAITSGVLSGAQEASAQKLSGAKKLDARVIQMAAYGLLISGPLNHILYEIMNKVFAGKEGPKVKLGQLLFSNLIISPIMNTVYISAMTVLAGHNSLAHVKGAVRQGLFPMQKMSWIISPVVLIFAQKFLDQQIWVPFFNVVAFIFGTYINTMMKRKRLAAEAK
ncbi:integral membrane protein 25D9-6, partial [Phycomyces blakesleeanus]